MFDNLKKQISKITGNKYVIGIYYTIRIAVFIYLFQKFIGGDIPDIIKNVLSHFLVQAGMIIWLGYQWRNGNKFMGLLSIIMFAIQFYYVNIANRKGKLFEYFKEETNIDSEELDMNKIYIENLKKLDKRIASNYLARFDDEATRHKILKEVKDKMNFLGKSDIEEEAVLEIYNKYFGVDEETELENMYKNAVENSPINV